MFVDIAASINKFQTCRFVNILAVANLPTDTGNLKLLIQTGQSKVHFHLRKSFCLCLYMFAIVLTINVLHQKLYFIKSFFHRILVMHCTTEHTLVFSCLSQSQKTIQSISIWDRCVFFYLEVYPEVTFRQLSLVYSVLLWICFRKTIDG